MPGYNPCLGEVEVKNDTFQNYQDFLNSENVHFSTFSTQVDTLAALRTTKQELDVLEDWVTATAGEEPVISVVAFRGSIRSEAHYIRSSSPTLTQGTGIVERLGIISTFSEFCVHKLIFFSFNALDHFLAFFLIWIHHPSTLGKADNFSCFGEKLPNLSTSMKASAFIDTDHILICMKYLWLQEMVFLKD